MQTEKSLIVQSSTGGNLATAENMAKYAMNAYLCWRRIFLFFFTFHPAPGWMSGCVCVCVVFGVWICVWYDMYIGYSLDIGTHTHCTTFFNCCCCTVPYSVPRTTLPGHVQSADPPVRGWQPRATLLATQHLLYILIAAAGAIAASPAEP